MYISVIINIFLFGFCDHILHGYCSSFLTAGRAMNFLKYCQYDFMFASRRNLFQPAKRPPDARRPARQVCYFADL